MNDEMDEKRRYDRESRETGLRVARDTIAKARKASLLKVGTEAARAEIDRMSIALVDHNFVSQANLRPTIQTVDALLLCMSIIPQKIGMDVFERKGYTSFIELLYAMKELMIADRDRAIGSSPVGPGL